MIEQRAEAMSLAPTRRVSASDPDGLPEAETLFARAAEHFDSLAKWNIAEEKRNAEFSWRAAELRGKAGQTDEAIRRYRDFVLDRPNDHRGPTAMLRMGHLHFESGRFTHAVDAFAECNRRYPLSFDGARAVLPLARTYLVMGPDRYGDAERALMMVLDDSAVFTPHAGEFVEALYLLGEVFERGGRYEPAIRRLQEAIDRYPDDPRAPRGRYLLGGAYRKSALQLRELASETLSVAELARIRDESQRRFATAQQVYRELIHRLEVRSAAQLEERERLYLHHSYLYEADCYFEMQRYADALVHYEHAASRLRDSARGLAAHVQMINCHVFLGQMREARVALARALVTVSTLPEGAFANRVATESRDNWKTYFEWLEQSELFRNS
jgi:tetratricopeptide (TPR) repeat protein